MIIHFFYLDTFVCKNGLPIIVVSIMLWSTRRRWTIVRSMTWLFRVMVVFWSIIWGSRFGWPFMPRSSWRSWSGTFSFVMFVWLFHYSNFYCFLIFIYHYRMIRDFISDFMTKVKLRCYFRIRFIILFHIITNVLIVHRSFMFVIFLF